MNNKSRVTISIDDDLLTRFDDAAKKGHRSRSQQVTRWSEMGERVEKRWTPQPSSAVQLPIPAALDDHRWRFYADPSRATVVAVHSLGLWLEFHAEFFEMMKHPEANTIAEAMQFAVYDDVKTGRHQVVVTRDGDSYSAVLERA